MNIGFLDRYPGKRDDEMEVYYDILKHNAIPYQRLFLTDSLFWEKVKELDVFVYKWGHQDDHHQIAKTIMPVIEHHMKVACFPNEKTYWHYDDKIRQYYLLRELGFPVIESYVFWDKRQALKWAEEAHYPVIFKLKGGAGSLNVILLKNRSSAIKIIRRMFGSGIKQGSFGLRHFIRTYNYDPVRIARHFLIKFRNGLIGRDILPFYQKHKNYAYFQKYLPGNEFDVRVTTAGNRVHAFRRFVRKDDFRASGSDKWDIDPDKIDRRMLEIALNISKQLGFQAMAYDFIYDENKEPKIVEMSYLYGGAGYPDFMNGYWDENLNWHSGRYWPQYFELLDLLGIPDLKLPGNLGAVSSYSKVKIP